MELDLAPGVVGQAEYWPGGANMPAVLIMHGFLQTRDFPTVSRLAEALADEGFSVLLPTLSLGLNRRQQSLACEAVHTHSMPQDVAELRAWSEWLIERTGKAPVLIGHSVGGVQLAALLDGNPDLRIGRVALISLSYFGDEQGPEQLADLRARARADLQRDPQAMHSYALSYCRQYTTTAADLLSYLDWDKERLRHALLSASRPVSVIYGDKDERIDKAWLDALGSRGVDVRPVAGANHFFDLAHEFDLLDEILRVTTGGKHG